MALATSCQDAAIYQRKPMGFPPGVKEEQQARYRLLQEIAWDTVKTYPPSGVSMGTTEE